MAAPEKFFDYDFLDDGLGQDIQWVAPQIGSALTPVNLNSADQGINAGWVFEWSGSDLGGLYGARKPLPAARDISARRFLWIAGFTNAFATNLKFADLADGGVRFYLTDSAGAYRGYILYGRDVTGNDANPPFAFGSFIAFNNALSQMWWCIDLDRTPDYSSGTLDLTDIVAIEAHVKNNLSISNTSNGKAGFGYILASGDNIIRAGEVGDPADFTLLPQSLATWNINNPLYPGGGRQGQGLTIIYDGANGQNYATISPVHVGDGLTTTYFRQGKGTLSAQLSMEGIKYRIAQGDTPKLLPCYMENDDGDRTHTINQSASDDVQFDSFTWSGYDTDIDEYAVEVTGSSSGSCEFIGNTFARAQFVRLRHATATDCIFDACNLVEINADTTMTGCAIRNTPSGKTALKITGAAGDYSGIEVRLNNPSATYDIALGSGGAGTYDLSGVTVPSGYTLKLRNDSANNITVTIAAGITTSTSTAGGTITIQQPPTTLTIARPNFLDGTTYVLFNTTQDTELAAGTVSGGAGLSLVLTSGTDYDTDDTLELRAAYVNGDTAKLPIIESLTAPSTTSINSAPTTQQAHTVYNAIGIDGSSRTEFSADYSNLEVDIVIAADFFGQNFMAWWVYNEATLNGLRNFIGAYTLIDEGNMRNNTSVLTVRFDNLTASNIKQIDNVRIFADDLSYPVKNPSTGGGAIDINWRVPVQTISVSGGISPTDAGAISAAVLSAAQTTPIHSDVRKMNNATLYGTGVAEDQWRGSE